MIDHASICTSNEIPAPQSTHYEWHRKQGQKSCLKGLIGNCMRYHLLHNDSLEGFTYKGKPLSHWMSDYNKAPRTKPTVKHVKEEYIIYDGRKWYPK